MKIAHRNPAANWFATPESDPVDDAYEAEVQSSTENGEREYASRMRRLQRAEQRLARAQATKAKRHHIADLQVLVDLRRAELEEYRRLMVGIPASTVHRGTGAHRPVPVVHGIPI